MPNTSPADPTQFCWPATFAGRRGGRMLCRTARAAMLLSLLSGCSGGVLDPQGPIGDGNMKILLNALGIMLVVVVPTLLATAGFAWWFRASNSRARYLPTWTYSGRIELVVWAIPLLVIMFLAGLMWIGAHELDPYKPIASDSKPVEVQVVSLDWKWLFIYPEQGIASVNELTVPAGVPVHFSLTSATVMNSFFVPQLGSMIATMNGMVTQLYLEASHAGDYYGQSAQFSGDGFSDMNFTVHALPANAFSAWVAKTQQAGPALDQAGYMSLLRESQNVRPFTYRAAEPDLFRKIVTLQLPPGGGPGTEGGGTPASPKGAQ